MDNYSRIDKLISQQREQSLKEHSLEHVGVDGEAGADILDGIYHDIAREAAGLKDEGTYDYRLAVRYRLKDMKWKAAAMAREADRKLQCLPWYRKWIRKLLKTIYHRILPGPKVNAVLLMRYSDQRYVKELYQKVLGRAMDKEGFCHNLQLLKEKKVSRLDLLDTFCNSGECKNPVRITGRRMARMIYGRGRTIKR